MRDSENKCQRPYCRQRVVVLGCAGPLCAQHHEEQMDEMTRVARARLIAEGKLKVST